MKKSSIVVGDRVELLREEKLDNHVQTVLAKGTLMEVVAIAPKVRMIIGEGFDNNPYFLNLVILGSTSKSRVRTNFCNVRKLRW